MSITPKGMSILELYRLYRNKKLIVNRRYQRKLVWTKEEKVSLIESILFNYPIPLILLGKSEKDENAYEIIDGMQRLNAICSFIENQFSVNERFFDVSQHPLANDLSKKGIFKAVKVTQDSLLTSDECVSFLEYSLAVTFYEPQSTRDIENVFDRINSNGKHLSPQEVRQAGVTTSFSELVRTLASEIRGDVSKEIIPLTEMPEISIDFKSVDLGYGVSAEDTFWCYQGIMSNSNRRDSADEQLLADLILSIALGSPFPAQKDNFDAYYGKSDNSKLDEIEIAVSKYGLENIKTDIKTVLSSIKNAIASVEPKNDRNFLRKKLSRSGRTNNPVKEPFYTLFMAFYDLIIQQEQEQFTPDMEQIKATSAKVKALCQRMDAEILILDDIIAQLEEENRRSPLYQYRLNKAKRLLNSNISVK